MANKEIITGYKAFNHDLTCSGFQYEIGKTYKIEGDIELGERGFHFCPKSPFDVLDCCPIIDDNGNMRRFARVSCPASKAISGDKETVTSELTVGEELMFDDLVIEQIRQALTTSYDYAKVATSYDYAKVATSYDYAKVAASGRGVQVVTSGDCVQVVASGDYAQVAASGDDAQVVASYDRAQVAVSGDCVQVVATGKNSVIAISGLNGYFKGVNGTFVSCANFDYDGKCNGFVTGCIGQNGLKENTWYTVSNGKGKFIECGVPLC